MRGDRGLGVARSADVGSIPAYAGEPASIVPPPFGSGVYPRVCGGTPPNPASARAARRLSPRMRGNPRRRFLQPGVLPSIPAYAGEPLRRSIAATLRRVYPRVCGGTPTKLVTNHSNIRLSPRMRGNREAQRGSDAVETSIPAYAGEPSSSSSSSSSSGVYPRVCGGTDGANPRVTRTSRLSPRMRGNLAV